MIILISTVSLIFILFFLYFIFSQLFLFPYLLRLRLLKSTLIQSQNVVVAELVSSLFYRKGPLSRNTSRSIWELFSCAWMAQATVRDFNFSWNVRALLRLWHLPEEDKHIPEVLLVFSRPSAPRLNSLILLGILARGIGLFILLLLLPCLLLVSFLLAIKSSLRPRIGRTL